MRRSRIILLVVAAFLVGVVVGGVIANRSTRFNLALAENKIAAANLAADRNFYGSTNLSPEFREYLKARIYQNVYSHYPSTRGHLLPKDWDYGEVDRQLLASRRIAVWKEGGVAWDWSSAITNK